LTGTRPPADRRVKRDLATPGRLGARPRRTRPPTLSLRHHRIGGREVVEEGFVGPLAGLVSRQSIGRVGWRSEAGRCGGEPQVLEDLPDDRRAVDQGDLLFIYKTTTMGRGSRWQERPSPGPGNRTSNRTQPRLREGFTLTPKTRPGPPLRAMVMSKHSHPLKVVKPLFDPCQSVYQLLF
jgi:hypothetical protein